MRLTLSIYLTLICCLSIFACDSEGDGLALTESGLLDYTPSNILFSTLNPGQSDVREVTLVNQGSAAMILQNIRVRQNDQIFSINYQPSEGAPLEAIPETWTLEPNGEPLVLLVKYEPNDSSLTGDEAVIIETNNAAQLEVVIPIRTTDAVPQILFTPTVLNFDSVDAGQVKELTISITNVGDAPLVIRSISISGSEDFTIRFSTDGVADSEPLTGDLSSPLEISPGDSQTLIVTYAPQVAGADLGEVLVLNNDPAQSEASLPLSANGAAPCIQVTPESFDFGAGLLVESLEVETPNVLPLLIESCGGSPLKIHRIEFEGETFGVAEEIEPFDEESLFILPSASNDLTFPNRTVDVGFWPLQEMSYGGRMLLHTNTSTEPIPVDLFGRGVENACPIPSTTMELYDVSPLEIITLDGTPSTDPGGEVTRWEWSVIERPTGSVSQVVESLTSVADPAGGGPEDDQMTPQAVFFVDLAGRYVIDLQVYDNLGQVSCEPRAVAQVVIEAIPEKDLHIQLVWSTPNDPDETDGAGTDVDLHFKHQNSEARWGESANNWDCYFFNKSPDWGLIGDFLDNPSLDIDDTNGAGPENVNLNRPEVGVSYEVGALYYRSESTFGDPGRDPRIEHPSYVTTRIFARGELIAEFVDRELNRVNQLWHVATINWCEDFTRCPEVIPEDRLYEEGEFAN